MKLPLLSFLGKKEIKGYYLAILFQDEQIQAVVFEETHGTIRLVNEATETLFAPIDTLPFDKLLRTLDHAISLAESALPNGIQTHKTIFGLKESWVENGQIKKEYLAILKHACEELDLQPIGFLIFPEAIAHLLQQEEGAPASGILIEIGKTTITATLLRAGRIIETKQGPIEDTLPNSVDHLLAYFADVEILPSRIIVADNAHREHLTQQFINHRWSKTLPFLHMPQVTPLPVGFDARAILHGTATQLGFSVIDVAPKQTIHTPSEQFTKTNSPGRSTLRDDPSTSGQTGQVKQGEPEKSKESQEIEKSEAVKELEDKEEIEQSHPVDSEQKTVDEQSADDFGFVMEKDVAQTIKNPTTFSSHLKDNTFEQPEETLAQETFAQIPEEVKEQEQGFGTRNNTAEPSGVMIAEGTQKVFSKLSKQIATGGLSVGSFFALLSKIPRYVLSPFKRLLGGSKTLLLIPFLLLCILIGIFWYIFGLRANVTLVMNPKTVQAQSDVTITTSQSTDLEKNILGGTAVSVDESGSTTTDATGKKDTGDKAKGVVTIYNNSDSTKIFSAGDILTASTGLKFTLDKGVTVASASGDIFSGTKPGTQDVSVSASTFGTEYNLPSGTTFSLGVSSIAAKNASAFSGGTKKSITVVAANDISKAQDDLISKLHDKAKQDLSQKNGDGRVILPTFISTTLSRKNTDKNVSDQANSITLSATVTYESIAYTNDDLKQLAKTLLKDKLTDSMTTTNGGISANLDNITANKDNTSIKATLTAKAGLLPRIDKTHVAQELAGKSLSEGKAALSDIQQLDSISGELSPNLFFLPKILPRLSSHIHIDIAGNE